MLILFNYFKFYSMLFEHLVSCAVFYLWYYTSVFVWRKAGHKGFNCKFQHVLLSTKHKKSLRAFQPFHVLSWNTCCAFCTNSECTFRRTSSLQYFKYKLKPCSLFMHIGMDIMALLICGLCVQRMGECRVCFLVWFIWVAWRLHRVRNRNETKEGVSMGVDL